MGLNDELQLALLFACARAGAIFLPLNFRLAVPELAAIVRHAGVRVLWSDATHRDMARQIRDALEVTGDADLPPPAIASIEGLIAVPSIKPVDYPDVAADAPCCSPIRRAQRASPRGPCTHRPGCWPTPRPVGGRTRCVPKTTSSRPCRCSTSAVCAFRRYRRCCVGRALRCIRASIRPPGSPTWRNIGRRCR
ncbi:hypothetical protein DRB87_16355 [Pandoraea sp. XY-2]|nr:hypothetical protein DRB87_16355 [Pandoraea sp. XY-2]